MRCYNCDDEGHAKYNCPKDPDVVEKYKNKKKGSKTGVSNFMFGFLFAQPKENPIPPSSWILLDTCSTSHVSNNPNQIGGVYYTKGQDFLCEGYVQSER